MAFEAKLTGVPTPEDAERLARELGTFEEDDFCNLPRYHIYLRLMIEGIAGDSFTATIPPNTRRYGIESCLFI